MEHLNIIITVAIAVLITAIVITCNWPRISAWIEGAIARSDHDELMQIYQHTWNGSEEDRATAWFRTREYLREWNFPEEMITEADCRYIYQVKRDEQTLNSKLSSGGRTISVTERRRVNGQFGA